MQVQVHPLTPTASPSEPRSAVYKHRRDTARSEHRSGLLADVKGKARTFG